MSRGMRFPPSAREGRRGRWARGAAVLGGVAALAACYSGDGTRAFAIGQQAPLARSVRVQRQAVQESLNPEKILENTKRKTQETIDGVAKGVDNVVNAPARLSEQAKQTVDGVVSTITSDDGKVLDESSPAGSVGAVTVSLAVLPYIPVSVYSSYLVATTGQGIEAGPYGIYGAAEGFATLVVLGMTLWSLTSFITRARGLPAGPFSLLGVSQALSIVAAFLFAGATALSGGDNINPLIEKKEKKLPEATKKLEAEVDKIAKEPVGFFAGIQKSFDDQIAGAQKAVDKQLGDVKAKVSEQASSVADQASKQVSQAASPLKDKVEKAAKEAADKAAATAKEATEKATAGAKEAAEKAKDQATAAASKVSAKVPKVGMPDYGDLLDD